MGPADGMSTVRHIMLGYIYEQCSIVLTRDDLDEARGWLVATYLPTRLGRPS